MFGLGARSEIFRCFLAQPDTPIKSVATLATETGYTKRNVSDECEMLERAGLLAQRAKTNRFYYSLARRAEFEALIGELPGIRPHWGPLLNIARQLLTLEEAADGVSAKTLPIRVRKALSAVETDLVELEIDADFSDVHGHDLWPAVEELGSRTLSQWSIGNWDDELQDDPIVRQITSASKRQASKECNDQVRRYRRVVDIADNPAGRMLAATLLENRSGVPASRSGERQTLTSSGFRGAEGN